jgi:hypothetical protein
VPGARALFRDLDDRWQPRELQPIPLRVIGCSALTLQVDYDRGTKDGDVLETKELTPAICARLLALAGRGSVLHDKHRMYIEIVGNGIPFLPQAPVWHRAAIDALASFDVLVLDVVDVVVSKLKRLSHDDLADIDAMVGRGLVPHASLLDRFRAVVDYMAYDARAADLPAYVANLHQVERDILVVPESEIDLPSWV